MLKLTIEVPEARDRAALATLRDGMKTVEIGHAAASATMAIAAQRGNPACDPLRPWGHPPFGRYRLLVRRNASPQQAREYGAHLLAFEPQSGAALDAESFGRIGLLVYAGPADRDRRLRRTQGGVRLAGGMMDAIVKRLGKRNEMELEIEQYRAPAWWQFWKRRMELEALSASTVAPLAPPSDELSVLQELMRGAVRRTPRSVSEDREERRDLDRSDDGWRSSASDSEAFHGRGGEFGGAGASTGWGSATGSARGVDGSGRIVAGAAAAAAVAAAAYAATSSEGKAPADSPGGADSGSDAGPSASADSSPGASDDAGSDTGTSTSTSTSY